MMATKILVLLGSPRRKGNSAILAGQIEKGAKAANSNTATVFESRTTGNMSSCFGVDFPKPENTVR